MSNVKNYMENVTPKHEAEILYYCHNALFTKDIIGILHPIHLKTDKNKKFRVSVQPK
jgi:hypothetical protein